MEPQGSLPSRNFFQLAHKHKDPKHDISAILCAPAHDTNKPKPQRLSPIRPLQHLEDLRETCVNLPCNARKRTPAIHQKRQALPLNLKQLIRASPKLVSDSSSSPDVSKAADAQVPPGRGAGLRECYYVVRNKYIYVYSHIYEGHIQINR